MKCPSCGSVSSAEARFCSVCGAALVDNTGDTTSIFPALDGRGPAASEVEEEQLKAALAKGNAMLIVTRGAGDVNRFLIDGDVTTVGRHPQSDIFLDDITVSRNHAKFVRTPEGFFLEDLGSLNGTYVNHTVLDGRVMLRDEDEIQIGKYRAIISLAE